MTVRLAARKSEFVRTHARLSRRRNPLEIGYAWELGETVEYRVPTGYRIRGLPGARHIRARYGDFELKVAEEGGAVRVSYRMRVSEPRIPASEYEGFRRFLLEVDAALNEVIVLER